MTKPTAKDHLVRPYFQQPSHPVTINLVGVGGTGSRVLTHLCSIHQALQAFNHPGLHVTAYDADKVSEANIGRSAFSAADVGRYKCIALIERVNRYYGLAWQALPIHFGPKSRGSNITITCVDSVASRRTMLRWIDNEDNHPNVSHAYQERQPYYWIDTGNSLNTGQVVIGTIDRYQPQEVIMASEFVRSGNKGRKIRIPDMQTLRHVFELLPEIDTQPEDTTPSCSLPEAISKQDLMINPMVATLAADLVWKLFRMARLSNQGYYINMLKGETRPIPLKPFMRDKHGNPVEEQTLISQP